MTKERVVSGEGSSLDDKRERGVLVGIGLRDPRSQKRDLGHPSVSPFDTAEGTSFVISLPTRLSESAAVTGTRKLHDPRTRHHGPWNQFARRQIALDNSAL